MGGILAQRDSATPSLNLTPDLWLPNAELNPSVLQGSLLSDCSTPINYSILLETKSFPEGSFLRALYEPLDPSLEPSNDFAIAPIVNDQPILGIGSHSAHPYELPNILPESNIFSQQLSSGFSASSNTITQEPEKVTDERSNLKSVTQGRKRKGEETIGRPAKKGCLKNTENAATHEGTCENTVGKDHGEGSMKSSEANDRAGRPTLSGRVPLMPTHLAEAGYQGEKRGVRGPGRKVHTKKPRSKAPKPTSKGAAKIPGKKKTK